MRHDAESKKNGNDGRLTGLVTSCVVIAI